MLFVFQSKKCESKKEKRWKRARNSSNSFAHTAVRLSHLDNIQIMTAILWIKSDASRHHLIPLWTASMKSTNKSSNNQLRHEKYTKTYRLAVQYTLHGSIGLPMIVKKVLWKNKTNCCGYFLRFLLTMYDSFFCGELRKFNVWDFHWNANKGGLKNWFLKQKKR